MENEIRIPVTIEMVSSTGVKPTTPNGTTPSTPITPQQPGGGQQLPPQIETVEAKKKSIDWGQALSVNLLVDSTKKLLSASGNSETTAMIETGMRYGTLAVRSLSGDPTAMITLGIEIIAEILKNEQKKRQEAQVNNEAQYNRILSGQVLLGSNVTVSTDRYGNKTYNRR